MDTQHGVHWVVPTVMISALAVGVVAAVGHDRFFQYYDGRLVGTKTDQKVVSNVAFAFAFVVKVFLVTASSTAFMQQLFYDLKRRGEKVVHVDTLFTTLRNILNFRHLKLWTRHGILFIVAADAACYDLHTGHVADRTINNVQLQPIRPQQSWIDTQSFASTQIDYSAVVRCGDNGTCGDLINNGPSGSLNSVAAASMARQEILPIALPQINSSYALTFNGPALNCSEVENSVFVAFNESLTKAHANNYIPGANSILGGVATIQGAGQYILKYNAWIADGLHNITNPYWNNYTNPSYDNGTNPNWNDGVSLVAPNGNNANYFYFNLSPDPANQDASLIQCSLYNASYDVSFSWVPDQNIVIQKVALAEALPYNSQVNVDTPDYGNLVYNSYLYAFSNILISTAINSTVDSSAGAPNAPNILYYNGYTSMTALQAIIENSTPSTPSTADIISTIETIFQNMTVSSMSSKALSIPRNQAQPVSGSTSRSVNVYVYSPKDLYIAYGSAILAALLCTLWGLFVMYRLNGAAYVLNFSTVLRMTRQAELDAIVDRGARNGQEPLPLGLAREKVRMGKGLGFVVVREDEQGVYLLRDTKNSAAVAERGPLQGVL